MPGGNASWKRWIVAVPGSAVAAFATTAASSDAGWYSP
jgi:hypothetical protein